MLNKAPLALLAPLALALAAHAQRCGMDGDGMECPNNLCCSRRGHCGLGSDYCGHGCQSGACYTRKRCGSPGDSGSCTNNYCCSKDGYCGLGDEYCGEGCQGDPPCGANIRCGNQAEAGIGEECTKNLCCSVWGYCGLGPEYCGTGCQNGACSTYEPCGSQAGGTRCTNDYCCSRYGSCGLGSHYCGAGCQSGSCYSFVAGAITGNGAAGINFTLQAL